MRVFAGLAGRALWYRTAATTLTKELAEIFSWRNSCEITDDCAGLVERRWSLRSRGVDQAEVAEPEMGARKNVETAMKGAWRACSSHYSPCDGEDEENETKFPRPH